MLTWIREKFGTVVIGGIIGFIAFVFVFYGVFSPKATRGLHEGAVAGKVNGDAIRLEEFNRELNRRMEYFKNMMGGKVSDEQLKAFRIREMVFQDLVRRKILVQQASKLGIQASDEQVKDTIRELPYFQKDGKFDVVTYKQVLEQNQYSPGGFERLVRDDISAQQWETFFGRRVAVSNEEARAEFLVANDKRKLKYVLLSTETAKKALDVSPEETKKYLADAAKQAQIKGYYEARKETAYKGKTFDAVKESIAHDLIASEKLQDVQKLNDRTAQEVQAALKADKGSDGKIAALLKSRGYAGADVKQTEWLSRQNVFVPGIGEATALLRDAFAKKSPIDATQGGQAKAYPTAAGVVVALMVDAQKPDLSKFDAERDQLIRQLTARKAQEIFQAWSEEALKKAKIDPNPAVVGSES